MECNLYEASEYKKIVKDLLDGKVVGFPTDTVYGLAIIYNDKSAFKKLYEIKNREINKPISMMVADKNVLNKVAIIDERSSKVIDNLMPGALTIILKAKENLPTHVTFSLKTIGVRIPTNDVALNILKEIKVPLLVTSANISNMPSLSKYIDVYDNFKDKISSMIKQDALNEMASTVVSVYDEIKIFREGLIKKEEIEKVLGE